MKLELKLGLPNRKFIMKLHGIAVVKVYFCFFMNREMVKKVLTDMWLIFNKYIIMTYQFIFWRKWPFFFPFMTILIRICGNHIQTLIIYSGMENSVK